MAGAGELDALLSAAMGRAQCGDRAAYEMVLREAAPVIRRIARSKGAPADFIEDVVQDVLITVHGARSAYDPSRSFVAWLTVISQRRTIDLLRKRGRLGAREIHAPLSYEGHADADDPAGEAERRSEAAQLHAAVAGLPAGQREAVEALALKEIPLDAASKSTGRTKTALKVNLHRAIATLRERMTGQPAWEGRGPRDKDEA